MKKFSRFAAVAMMGAALVALPSCDLFGDDEDEEDLENSAGDGNGDNGKEEIHYLAFDSISWKVIDISGDDDPRPVDILSAGFVFNFNPSDSLTSCRISFVEPVPFEYRPEMPENEFPNYNGILEFGDKWFFKERVSGIANMVVTASTINGDTLRSKPVTLSYDWIDGISVVK